MAVFTLSAFTFGGGYVIVPLMRQKFVNEFKWLEEEEMLNLIAIAQSTPGAIAVNASVLVGYRLAGIGGALITVLGTALPPLVIITLVSFLYASIRDNPIVNALMMGMRIGVAAVIVDAVINLIKNIVKTKNWFQILLIPIAFIAVYFFNINIVIVLFIAAVSGGIYTFFSARRREGLSK